MEEGEERCTFHVGGWVFSIPLNRLAYFQDSLLLKSAREHGHKSTLFIDGDGRAFRHVYEYIRTGKLTSACALEMNMVHELAAGLHLTELHQVVEHLLQVSDCCQTGAFNSKPEPECSLHKFMPQGLVSAPLVASKEEVLCCFVLVDHMRLHPDLITHDNLLWLCEDVAIIECSSHLFRFIANFLQSGTILLPELFNEYGELYDEARAVGMSEFIEMLQDRHDWKNRSSSSYSCPAGQMSCAVEPLYVLSLSLLVKYPDSSLGQLCVDSNLEGSRLYITGNGVLFQHVENWLGTSRLPLTRTAEELPYLCAYLGNQDEVYLAIREAMQEFFHRRETSCMSAMSWSASVSTFTLYKVVKVYTGTHWYATYFKTLIKHPELLSNSTKSKWIVFGESLLVKGDGQMFRHILNFLRCGRLLLPADFREWPLLCQEIEEFQIPALSSALQNSLDYRAWCEASAQPRNLFTSCKAEDIVLDSNLDSEDLLHESEPLSFQRESPENTLLPSEMSSTHSDNEAVCVSVGASGSITEVRPAEKTDKISLTSRICHSPLTTKVSSGSCPHKEQTIETSSQRLPVITACSGSKSISEAYREMASMLHMLWESRPKKEGPLLDRLALLMETATLSRTLLEQSDTEKSALTAAQVTTAHSNWQSYREQQQYSDIDSAQRKHTHTKERLEHQAHMLGQLGQNPSRDQRNMQRRSMRGRVFPITSFTWPVGGCVLKVEHPAVLGRGEAGGYFTDSIIYTDEEPQMVQPARREDVAFAYFSMSYEEMVHARECHAFLTGTISDSSRLGSEDCVVKLVHQLWDNTPLRTSRDDDLWKLWCLLPTEYFRKLVESILCVYQFSWYFSVNTGHIGVNKFVQKLLTVIKVNPNKQLDKQEQLLQWVKFTLPLAKRYTACVRELLRKMSLNTVSLFPPDLLEVTTPTTNRLSSDQCPSSSTASFD